MYGIQIETKFQSVKNDIIFRYLYGLKIIKPFVNTIPRYLSILFIRNPNIILTYLILYLDT